MRLLLLLLLLASPVSAATITGTIYDSNLNPVDDALVTISTQPQQRVLSTDGTYSFDVPPGIYNITLSKDTTTVTERLDVEQNGTFTFDLFLLSDLSEESELYEIINDFEEPPDPLPEETGPWPLVILAIFIIAVLFGPYWWLRYRLQLPAFETRENPVLTILKEHGGRMTQKELRKHLPNSEAKISLMVAELEAKGTLEKIKKGRGNILVLK